MKRPPWRAGRDEQHERFARAVDGHAADREFDEELAIVSALRRLGSEAELDDEARQRIERRATSDPGPVRRHPRHPRHRTRLPVAAALALLALAGLGVLLSGTALPGDALYDLKRLREAAELRLTFGEEERALKHLELAGRRVDELTLLADRSAPDEHAFAIALDDFTHQARSGAATLTAVATSSDGRQLGRLRSWATEQAAELAALRPALPSVAEPTLLLDRIEQRALALADRMGCFQVTSGEFDELGALPAAGVCRETLGELPVLPTEPGPTPEPAQPTKPTEEPLAVAPDTSGWERERDGTDRTSGPTSVRLPEPSVTTTPPPVVEAPVPTTVPGPRLPETDGGDPPAVSIPPLLPGLPGISIG
ncbi:DUF5667 domain-containing protein [Prauserella shujinwangii]|uniref:DUF5667 domain-containing protein n=1 Tax=Prauserella shujinwangii TaxID=1453103 RepID=UPI0011B23E06|nr:DUF5667 domain-containing protein [Prauserella shujinwangii]